MAAISSPQSTVQGNENISVPLPPKLRFSHIPYSYRQICSLRGYESQIDRIMHTIKNICKISDPQHRQYLVMSSKYRSRVVMSTPEERVTILGCDINLGAFFSHDPDEISFYRMIKIFNQPLNEQQNLLITEKRRQYDQNKREIIAKIIENLFQFAPPYIACDALEETAIQETQLKYLPTSEECPSDLPLKELVCRNQGLFLGHNHNDIAKIAALFKSTIMKQLSQLGVKHLYVELPAARLYQQFALFNQNNPNHNDTELRALKERLKNHRVSNYKKFLEICIIAKRWGIQVWPVDISFNHLSEISSFDIAITQRNRVMFKNIKYYSSLLPEGKKYVGLFGAMHYQLSSDLCIPNIHIRLDDQLQNKKNSKNLREQDEAQKRLIEFHQQLYAQLSLEYKIAYKNSPDVFLTILPSSQESNQKPESGQSNLGAISNSLIAPNGETVSSVSNPIFNSVPYTLELHKKS